MLKLILRCAVVWFYTVALILILQFGAVIGSLFSQDVQVELSVCVQAPLKLDELSGAAAAEGFQVSVATTNDQRCFNGTAVKLNLAYTGSATGFLSADESLRQRLTVMGVSVTGKSFSTKTNSDIALFFGFLLALACSVLFLRYQRRKASFVCAPEAPAPSPQDGLSAQISWTALTVIGMVVLVWLPFQLFADQIKVPNYLLFTPDTDQLSLITVIYLVILAPICEEIIFRAWLLEAWKNLIGTWLALAASAVAFSVVHPMSPVANLIFVIPGVLFGLLWIKYRSVVLCALAHSLYNGFVLLTLANGWSVSLR